MKYLKMYENQITLKEFTSPDSYWYYKPNPFGRDQTPGFSPIEAILTVKKKSGFGYFKFLVLYFNTNRINPFKTIEFFTDQIEDLLSKIRPATEKEINKFKEEVEFYSTTNKYNL